jgi:hypothetical protein
MADHLTFLSCVRDGAVAQIAPSETPITELAIRAPLEVRLDIEGKPSGQIDEVVVNLALYGPGDVKSLDRVEIVRVDPPPASIGFEPNSIPVIEFRRPDLPWLFSPVPLTDAAHQKLPPWLCLVVVPMDVVVLEPGRHGQLPCLRCPARELPDPEDSWAWAHAQILNLEPGESVYAILEDQPERALSRLICPRRLGADRNYLACLVPTFKAGAEAALGLEVTTETLEPAWPSPAVAPSDLLIDLPVYFHWGFTTGAAGDFETLVGRLTPHAVTGGMTVRDLDLSEPGAEVIVSEAGDPPELLPFAGAFAAEGHRESRWIRPAGQRFEAELRGKFDAAADAATTLVGPPLYGRWYAGVSRIPEDDQGPHWLRDLNLDPRLRAYASLGVQTAQKHQEALMASAWEQLDQVEAVNRALRQAQLAREVSGAAMRRRLDKLRPATLMQLTRGTHGEVAYRDGTVHEAVAESEAPDGVVSATLRCITRPGGPLVRRTARNRRMDSHAFVRDVASGAIHFDTRAHGVAKRMVTLDDLVVATQFSYFTRGTSGILPPALREQRDAYNAAGFSVWTETAPRVTIDRDYLTNRLGSSTKFARAFNTMSTHMARLERMGPTPPGGTPGFPDFDDMAGQVKKQLDPEQTVKAHALSRLEAEVTALGDPLDPILAAPYFPQPMYEVLRDMAPEYLLAGNEGLPPESLGLVQTNGAFVYAYLIGLNHAMAAELLWCGYPTDQRGSYFRRFWDRAGQASEVSQGQPADAHGAVDIEPLHELSPDLRLLGNRPGSAPDFLTLVIRGEFLHRFPDAWISARPAIFDGDRRVPAADGAKEPIFSGQLAEDAAFFAFDLTLAQARGGDTAPGWFIVFREPPTGVRFGLDVLDQADVQPPESLDDLAWEHVMNEAEGDRYANTRHSRVTADTRFAEGVDPLAAGSEPVTWAADSAHMARCFMQWPVSVALHAEALLPPAA